MTAYEKAEYHFPDSSAHGHYLYPVQRCRTRLFATLLDWIHRVHLQSEFWEIYSAFSVFEMVFIPVVMYMQNTEEGSRLIGNGTDNLQCNLFSLNALVHGLLFDVSVGFQFGHVLFLDEQPFCPVDKADFFHFFLNGQGFLFKSAQPFPRTLHPFQCHFDGCSGGRSGQRENTVPGKPVMRFLINIGSDQ